MEKIAESHRSASDELQPDYNQKIMNKIYAFYDSLEFVDVAFNVSNPPITVSAHRLILAAASPFFRRMFNSAGGECSVINIADINSEEFTHLIAFCYNGKALLTTANVGFMLKGAMQFELTDAVTECVNYLMKHLSEYTLPKAFALANETGCQILEKQITDYTVANFEKVSQDTVNELNAQQMQTILLNPVMRTYDQTIRFEVIKRWYELNKPARELILPNLIGSLKLAHFDSEFLVEQIRPLPGCTDLAEKAIKERLEGMSLLVMNIGEYTEQHLLQYKKEEDEWVKCDVNMNVYGAVTSVYFNKKIYGIAKDDEEEIYSFDLQTKTKSILPPMLNRLNCESLVLLNGKIYVMGTKIGYSNSQMLMEMFNPSTDEWQTKAAMPNACWGSRAVALNGKIYVIGGQSFQTRKTSAAVQSYDPETDIWAECAPLAEGRRNHGAAVHKGHIYVLGGYYYTSTFGGFMSSVERYNPERNEWAKIGSLNDERDFICGISFNNELLAFGGWVGFVYSSGIEVYDEENDKWVEKKGLPDSGKFNAYVVPTVLIN